MSKRMFGMRTKGDKRAAAEARSAQRRSERTAVEEGQRLRSERAVSGRRLRGAGRRQLAFAGLENGLATTLGG